MTKTGTRPNLLLITSDQQHFSTLGVTNPRIKTPALDRLCAEGTRFTRAYCPNPVCSPSRASLITGQYPSQHGCWTIGVKLPEDVPTLGGMLSGAGYATSLVGKAHFQPLASVPGSESLEVQPTLRDLDFWRDFHGPWYGFEHVEVARNHADESHAGQHYALWLEEQGLDNWRDYFQPVSGEGGPLTPKPVGGGAYWQREHGSWELPEHLHYSAWTAERTIAQIERAASEDRPFFTWASFHDPHPPYLAPEPWASMYNPAAMEPGTLQPGELERMPPPHRLTAEPASDFSAYHEPFQAHGLHSHLYDAEQLRRDMAVYYGMVSLMDRHIGHILDGLERLGVSDDTLVVFTTDHGHFLGQHGLVAKGPFHYEDLLKLPFVVRWPGRVPADAASGALQSLVDIAPTFLSAAGETVPGAMQGVNQLGVWQGRNASARDHVLVENRHNPVRPHLRSYVEDRYKLTVYRDADYGELFDLADDPDERRNLWDEPEAQALKTRLLGAFLRAVLAAEPTRMPRVAHA